MAIWIVNFPLAPSENTRLMAVRGRLIKTKDHRRYTDLCHLWAASNRKSFDQVKDSLHRLKTSCEGLRRPFALQIDCYFIFHIDRILTVNKKNEQLDADNRLKATLDGFSKILGIDDKAFYRASCEKITTTKESNECTIMRISQVTPRSLEQIKELMALEMRPGI